jgi:hypothetical protein
VRAQRLPKKELDQLATSIVRGESHSRVRACVEHASREVREVKRSRCVATCVERATGQTWTCVLADGHPHTHYSEERVGGELRSVSWYGDMVVVGAPVATHLEKGKKGDEFAG